MPITYPVVKERIASRRVSRTATGTEAYREYDVLHRDPEIMLASGMLPAHADPHPYLGNVYVDRIEVDPPVADNKYCRVKVYYKEWTLGLTPYAENWLWDIGSQQINITSVANGSYYLDIPATADSGGAIRVDASGTQGCDVYRPNNTLRVSKLYASMGMWDREFLERMTTMVNADYWHGYYPGEVLFLGAGISRTEEGKVQVEFNFVVSRWQSEGVTITLVDPATGGEQDVVVYPSPFDYVWYQYEDTATDVDATSKTVTRKIKSVHIAQVYDRANFSEFNLVGPYG